MSAVLWLFFSPPLVIVVVFHLVGGFGGVDYMKSKKAMIYLSHVNFRETMLSAKHTSSSCSCSCSCALGPRTSCEAYTPLTIIGLRLPKMTLPLPRPMLIESPSHLRPLPLSICASSCVWVQIFAFFDRLIIAGGRCLFLVASFFLTSRSSELGMCCFPARFVVVPSKVVTSNVGPEKIF